MALVQPNIDPYISIGKSTVVWVGGTITGLGLSQYIDPVVLTDGFNHIFAGAKEIWQGVWILIPAGIAGWSAWQKRERGKLTTVASVPGVIVDVNPNVASPEAVAVAKDPTVPNVRLRVP